MKPIILIPAYKPDINVLPEIIKKVNAFNVGKVIVVDDGSGTGYKSVFDHVSTLENTLVLHHPENLGKGAALRTGFEHILKFKIQANTVITVDADGQHLPEDVNQILIAAHKEPDSLILGVRGFSGKVPLRSLLGNKATYLIFRGLVGQKITDTQTGLRGIPLHLLDDLIQLESDRYAYELEMLLTLIQNKTSVKEVVITTVYEDNNSVSSFRPIVDSILIYRTLIAWWFAFRLREMVRYSLSGIFSTVADFGIYILLIQLSCGFVTASVFARIISVLIHFSANKYFTFSYKDAPNLIEIIKYLMVVAFNLSASISLIYLFITYLSVDELSSKILAQLLLFFATYTLLNGFVFLRQKKKS